MGDGPTDPELLAQQVSYYRARAHRYDDWWYRRGIYSLDPERQAVWDADVARLEAEIDALAPAGSVLELACGTGLWTERVARHADRVVAVDSSPEAIALNRARVGDDRVTYVEADLFEWEPAERYDVVFFSFWVSHVPPSRFAGFWDKVRRSLLPGGRAIFIDNRTAWFVDPDVPVRTGVAQTRTDAGDDRSYEIVKVYYAPDELAGLLEALGWVAHVRDVGEYFVMGWARPS